MTDTNVDLAWVKPGVWARVERERFPGSRNTVEGLLIELAGVLWVSDPADRWGARLQITHRLDGALMSSILSIAPVPMPEPPDKSILEWILADGTINIAFRYLGRWWLGGSALSFPWDEVRLGTSERPVSVVRWGR